MTRKDYIRLPNRDYFLERGVDIPGFVWKEPPFRFDPGGFIPSDASLHKRMYDGDLQRQALMCWQEGAFNEGVYCCASEPHDGKALYFAAHLVHSWLNDNPTGKVVWTPMWSHGFKNALVEEARHCDLLVITNMTPNSSAVKLEKVRDTLLYFSSIPRIVVVAGEDPVSFFARRLYFKLNGMYFHSSASVKRTVEVL